MAVIFNWMLHSFCQAIQDITRTYDNPPEEIVTLVYDKIDVNREGKEPRDCPDPSPAVGLVVSGPILMRFLFFCFVSSGELTLEEFISGAKEHPDIMEMLTRMMDLSNVLEIIIKGQKKNTIKWGRRCWRRLLHTSDWEPSPTLTHAQWT